MLSSEEAPAKRSAWQDEDLASWTSEASLCLSSSAVLEKLDLGGSSGRTSPEFCHRTKGEPLAPSSGSWKTAGMLYRGECWTLSSSEYPSDAAVSFLSGILCPDAPQEYFLSPIACEGIIRRAERRGRSLPPTLKAALQEAIRSNSDTPDHRASGGGSGPLIQDDLSATLATSQDQILFQPKEVLPFNATQVTCPHNGNNPQWGDACHTLAATDRPPHIVASKHDPTYAISGNIIGREPENGGHHLGIEDDGAMFTLTTADRHAVAFSWNAANSFTTGEDVSPTLKASHSSEPAVCMASGQANAEVMEECAPCQASRQYKDPPIVALSNGDDVCGTLCARDYKGVGSQYVSEGKVIAVDQGSGYIVRRLMPVECERLQGFPDGWTDLGGSPDAPRYKACGNSMAVPVINYIGRRIEAVDAI